MNAFTGSAAGLRQTSSAIQGAPENIAKYQSERPIGTQETAWIWRHTKRDGLELFRGSYVKYKAARHYHTVPAIGIVEQGAMTSYYRGATHILPTGTVFLINPGEVHAPGPAKAPGWLLRVFYFEKKFYQSLSSIFGHNPLRFSHVFVKDQTLADSLLTLHRAMEDSNDSLEIDSTFVSIFGRLAEHYACDRAQSSTAASERNKINRVKQYLEAHYIKNHTLEELSVVAQLSPYYLLRTFQRAVGLTPHAYLNQIRIELAMQLLREGKAISEAAFDTGFTDQSHFTRNFKLMMGVTPGQFHARLSVGGNGVQSRRLRRS
jgi:AraC-like DNA-binding protein/quercetin dioxygenase-like cupin family protein